MKECYLCIVVSKVPEKINLKQERFIFHSFRGPMVAWPRVRGQTIMVVESCGRNSSPHRRQEAENEEGTEDPEALSMACPQ
jgi:hypothetical protein